MRIHRADDDPVRHLQVYRLTERQDEPPVADPPCDGIEIAQEVGVA